MKLKKLFSIFFLLIIIFSANAEDSESDFTVPLNNSNLESPSITILKGSEISSRGNNDLSSVASSIPGLTFAGGTSRPRFLQIRGVGERELFEGIPTASVGFFYNSIDLTGIGGAATFFDVDSLEVIKGPNNFKGPSTIGGAIFLETEAPTEFNAGKVLAGFGNDNNREFGVASGGKINEEFLYRASAYKASQDGFRRNTFLERSDTNNRDTTSASFSTKYKNSSDVSISTNLLASKIDDGYDAFTINNDFQTESDKPGVDEQRTIGASLITSIPIEFGSLTSTAAFAKSGMRQSFDADWGNPSFWDPYNPYDYFFDQRRRPMNFYHDLKIESQPLDISSSFDVSSELGFFAGRSKESSDIDEFASDIPYRSYDSRFKVDTLSPYAKVNFVFAPLWTFSIGGRVDNKKYSFNDSTENNISRDDTLIGGIAEIRKYRSNRDFSYFFISQGEKQGGVNPSILVPQERKIYDTENLTMFEVGDVGEFYSGVLVTKTGIFYGRRDDTQVKSSFQSDPTNPATFTYFTDNAANGNLYGVENDTTVNVSERFSVRLIGQLLNTNIFDYETSTRQIDGRGLSYAPEWSYDFSTKYDLGEGLYVQGNISGKAPFYFDDSFDERSRAYHLVGLTSGYRFGNYQIEIYGNNVFDDRYETRGFKFGNEPPDFEPKKYVQLGDRAEYGVRGIYVW